MAEGPKDGLRPEGWAEGPKKEKMADETTPEKAAPKIAPQAVEATRVAVPPGSATVRLTPSAIWKVTNFIPAVWENDHGNPYHNGAGARSTSPGLNRASARTSNAATTPELPYMFS